MRLLLDTHVLLWWLNNSTELGERARALISDSNNVAYLSAACIWEIRIKQALGKVELPAKFDSILASESFEELPITVEHAHAVYALPLHHRDPFDRMLIAQAQVEELTILSRDPEFSRYKTELIAV